MATIYKRTRRKPIPEGAEIISRNGQRFALWSDRRTKRRQRAPLSDDGRVVIVQADCYTIEWFDHENKRRRKGTRIADKDAAQRLANKLETAAMQRREGLIDARLERLAQEGRRPLREHLADYEAHLKAANRSPDHVNRTARLIRTIAQAAGVTGIGEITADNVNTFASDLGQRRSARTVQAHLTAIKSFTWWLAANGKLPADPLASVRKPNPKTDRRRERRMLLPEEWHWLRSVTLTDGVRHHNMAAAERVLLYATAIQTGLRSGELRSLTRGRLYLDALPPYIVCKAGSTKNQQDAQQYIQPELAAELRQHVGRKAPAAPVFAMPHETDVAAMLRADLVAARRAWLRATKHDPEERARREQSDFLCAVNHEGESLDFHSLRHTCGAWLAMSGAHPKAVQAVMRHSTITLTMDTYGHLFPGQEAESVARLPSMLGDGPEALRATGTCDAGIEGVAGGGKRSPGGRGWAHQGQQLAGASVRGAASGGEALRADSGLVCSPKVLQSHNLGDSRQTAATAGENRPGRIRTPDQGIMSPLL
jgi:integrase